MTMSNDYDYNNNNNYQYEYHSWHCHWKNDKVKVELHYLRFTYA